MPKGDICNIDNCNRIIKSGSICQVHWWRFKKYKSYDLPIKSNICKVKDCDKLKDGKYNVCAMHRSRKSRHKSFEIPIRPGLPEGVAMICIHHGERTIEQVYKNGQYKYNRCVECRKVSNERCKKKNPNRKMTRNYYFIGKDKFKVEIKEYEKLFKEQNGLCKICNLPETMKSANAYSIKRLAIDHCHKTKKIRGLLCHHCNVSLGAFKDSIELLEVAIQYLKDSQ